ILYEAALSEAVRATVEPSLIDHVEAYDDADLEGRVNSHLPTVDELRRRDHHYRFVTSAGKSYVLKRKRKRYWIDQRVAPGPFGLPLAEWPLRYRHENHTAFLVTDAPGEQLRLPTALAGGSPEPDL